MTKKRKITSLKVNEELWKIVKKKCVDFNLKISDYIEDLIKKDLKKDKIENIKNGGL